MQWKRATTLHRNARTTPTQSPVSCCLRSGNTKRLGPAPQAEIPGAKDTTTLRHETTLYTKVADAHQRALPQPPRPQNILENI